MSARDLTSRRCDPTEKGTDGIGCFEKTNRDCRWRVHRIGVDANRPLYKPEYWDKVQDLDYNTNTKDPIFTCMPLGVPRMGPPTQIVQTAKYVIFFYSGRVYPISFESFRLMAGDTIRCGPRI